MNSRERSPGRNGRIARRMFLHANVPYRGLSRLIMRRSVMKLSATDFSPDNTILRGGSRFSLRLPFGWVVRPDFCSLVTNAIGKRFRKFGSRPRRWAGYRDFTVWTYVDDAMFVELDIPSRMGPSVICWGSCAKRLSGGVAITKKSFVWRKMVSAERTPGFPH